MTLSDQILQKRAEIHTKRAIKKAMQCDSFESRLEAWPLLNETHLVTVSADRTIKHVGVLWLPLTIKE